MVRSGGVRRLAAQVAALATVLAVSGCAEEEPETCGPATEPEAEAANEAFLEAMTGEEDFRDGITGHGLSKDDDGWFILVLVAPGKMDSADRPGCFQGVPVEYETGGPFTGD